MPERFVLEVSDRCRRLDRLGLYRAEDVERDEGGTYVFGGEGAPLYLRCLRQDGCVIYVVEGTGDPYTYRLVPFSGGG